MPKQAEEHKEEEGHKTAGAGEELTLEQLTRKSVLECGDLISECEILT
ncbi:MAG: hypothetical protein ACK559_32475 [bacterium]